VSGEREPAPAACRTQAEARFDDGLYCAECVVQAIADRHGLESELLPKLATGFCSGMARTGGTCGAVTGGVLALNLFLGRTSPEQPVEANYAMVKAFVEEFGTTFGGLNCSDLLGCDLGTDAGQQRFRDAALHTRCRAYTGHAAEAVARLLDGAVTSGTGGDTA
jgi:C_GCAxxG_C_C family probable redox protein